MTSRSFPYALRLSLREQRAGTTLVAQLLTAAVPVRKLASSFRLSGDERAFAREVLGELTALWVFRCNQRRFCGDFGVVDMSAAGARPRRVWGIELKRNAPLRIGRVGRQLANHGAMAHELASTIGHRVEAQPICGDRSAVTSFLRGRTRR